MKISAHPVQLALLTLCLAGLPLFAADTQLSYRIHPASSAIAKVAVMGVSSKTAHFPKISGNVKFNPERLRTTSLDVNIDARALKAGGGATEKRLKGKDFFHVAKYPTVRFSGSSLTMSGKRTGRISGKLTARGITRPVSFGVTFSTPPAQAKRGQAVSLTARTTINRRNFGMKAFSGVVGKQVSIRVNTRLKPL